MNIVREQPDISIYLIVFTIYLFLQKNEKNNRSLFGNERQTCYFYTYAASRLR